MNNDWMDYLVILKNHHYFSSAVNNLVITFN